MTHAFFTHVHYGQFDRPGVRERVVAEMARVHDGGVVIGGDLLELWLDPEVPGVLN